MPIGNIGTGRLIWGSLWRTGLCGVLLGAGFGGLYGAAFGTLIFPLVGTAIGLFFGAITGAAVGLPVGLIDGLTLGALLHLLERHRSSHNTPLEARVLRRLGAATCAAATLAALFVDWSLNGVPDPDGFATRRILRLLLSRQDAYSGLQAEAFTLTIWVFAPMSVAFLGSWLAGRLVAGWYAGTVCPPHPPSHGA